MPEVLTTRDLNRATLARQLLLARADLAVADAVAHVGPLQAQEPRPPFLALAARLAGFDAEALRAALRSGDLVRGTLLRGTLHVATPTQFARLRPPLQPALDAGLRGIGERGRRLDRDAVAAAAEELLAVGPRDFDGLRDGLAERFPQEDVRALGHAVRMLLPLVMEPTEDRWCFPRAARFRPAVDVVGPLGADDPAALVAPYLAAYGPATAADLAAWSGVRGARAILDAARDGLVVLHDEDGRELVDLPAAPRPGGDAEAPPRLLPEFDSLLLAFDDRRRLLDDAHRAEVVTKNLRVRATFLLDGRIAGTWSLRRRGRRAVVELAPFGRLRRADAEALEAEAAALAAIAEPDAAGVEVSRASR